VRVSGDDGRAVYVAHPYWNGLHVDDIASQDGYVGIESTRRPRTRPGARLALVGRALRTGRPVMGIATDDQHYPLFGSVPRGRWSAPQRTEAAIIDALRAERRISRGR
jgi:hypothetical protein